MGRSSETVLRTIGGKGIVGNPQQSPVGRGSGPQSNVERASFPDPGSKKSSRGK